ncbi:MOSC domain-containing protein [Phytoactinopolyspora alkaliphila]|uniref:MOSC domain-containing protein n=1 Tax=Phytoactinopolyspora alkaliphila TaxID=1783498 RepID=A0A6N9YKU8_9ACTN|nr:MOSC domain-containing protein [Phytoactinopolyspora alkaliphila]NED95666.1 MOSC domain-containing protein [Phytoactinopolyspora alkaliphila]
MPEITAVCRVFALLPDPGPVGTTAIDKRPVTGRATVRRFGIYADLQADRAHHGGIDQAVYAYADEDAAWWANELGREITPGLFGENLRTSGLETSDAVLGEQWSVGADGLVLEVTSPRTPCATFARRMEEHRWVRRFSAKAATGAYFRVVQPGTIGMGDEIAVTHRPAHGVSVRDVFTGPTREQAAALLSAHDAGELALSDAVLAKSRRAAARDR